MTEAKFFIGIKALTNKKNKILVLKAGPLETKYTKKNFWDLPGGRIKIGHNVRDTIRREVREELGISSRNLKIMDVFDASVSKFKVGKFFLMLITYRCKLLNDRIKFKLSQEHSDYKWVDASEAKKLLSTKFANSFIGRLNDI